MASCHPCDPLWDLVLVIADQLWSYGEYSVVIDPVPTQQLVDVQWAGLQAGRIIGAPTDVEITRYGSGPAVIVRVTYVDPDGLGLVRAQQRLDALRLSVRRHRTGKQTAPEPRRRS
jgi:hypothetical protein